MQKKTKVEDLIVLLRKKKRKVGNIKQQWWASGPVGQWHWAILFGQKRGSNRNWELGFQKQSSNLKKEKCGKGVRG